MVDYNALKREATLRGFGKGLGALGAGLIQMGAPSTRLPGDRPGLLDAYNAYQQGFQGGYGQVMNQPMEEYRLKQMEYEQDRMEREKARRLAAQRSINQAIMGGGMGAPAGASPYTPQQQAVLRGMEPSAALGIIGQQAFKTPDFKEVNGQLVRIDGSQVTPVFGTPKTPAHKQAFNIKTQQPVFASDEQIAGNPNLIPLKTGMEIVSDGKGGFKVSEGFLGGGGGGSSDLTNSVRTELQQVVTGSGDALYRLNQMQENYDPSFLTLEGTLKRLGFAALDMIDPTMLGPEEAAEYDKMITFDQNTQRLLSGELNRLSGAAVSPEEYKRIAGGMPNLDDGPRRYKTKLDNTIKEIRMAHARAQYYLNGGIKDISDVRVEDMPRTIQERGDSIARNLRLKNKGISDDDVTRIVKDQLRTEFGL